MGETIEENDPLVNGLIIRILRDHRRNGLQRKCFYSLNGFKKTKDLEKKLQISFSEIAKALKTHF